MSPAGADPGARQSLAPGCTPWLRRLPPGGDVSGPHIGSCRGIVRAAAVALLATAAPARAQSEASELRGAGATASELSITQSAWARELVAHLGFSTALDASASDAEHFGLLCPEGAELATEAGGRRAAGEAFGVNAELPESGPGEPVRMVVSVPATALYQLEVEGVGNQRWGIDGVPVGHLDLSTLGAADAPVILPLRAGPHELRGTMTREARAERVRLVAWRMLCIAPAEGWRGKRALSWGGYARTLVRAFGLQSRLPEEESLEQRIEAEEFASASAGGGLSTRRLREGASGDAWAMAATSPAEFTWRLRLEKPQVVTIAARTHGSAPQIWSVDGRYRVTLDPPERPGGFSWSPVATLALAAGEHAVRAHVARGSGVDALRVIHHRSSDADHLRLVQELGLPVGAPDSPVPQSIARRSLRRPLVLELANALGRRLAGARAVHSPVVLAELDAEAPEPRPLSPVLPSEL